MRIVQAANFVSRTSGGLRTAVDQLAEGYAGHGHEVVQVLPGERETDVPTPWGRRVTLRSVPMGRTGYRLMVDRERVRRRLAELRPDAVEVHDRTTLRHLGPWARGRGIPSLVVSHERLDRWLQQWVPARLPVARLADRSNTALAEGFDAVVCTTEWAAEEFRRLAVPPPFVVPLAADTLAWPGRTSARPAGDGVRLVMASRLSPEKKPGLALDAVRELVRRGMPVHLVVAGDGPLRSRLRASGRDLPVTWAGYVADRAALGRLLADADVALAPGPVETFGLAALEALACGTPVVGHSGSAVPGVVGPSAGRGAATPAGFADAVEDLLGVPEVVRRSAARARAEQFSWAETVRGFLAVHRGLEVGSPVGVA